MSYVCMRVAVTCAHLRVCNSVARACACSQQCGAACSVRMHTGVRAHSCTIRGMLVVSGLWVGGWERAGAWVAGGGGFGLWCSEYSILPNCMARSLASPCRLLPCFSTSPRTTQVRASGCRTPRQRQPRLDSLPLKMNKTPPHAQLAVGLPAHIPSPHGPSVLFTQQCVALEPCAIPHTSPGWQEPRHHHGHCSHLASRL